MAQGRPNPPPVIPPRDYQEGFALPTSPTPPKRILQEEEAFLLRSPPVPPRDEPPISHLVSSQPLVFPEKTELSPRCFSSVQVAFEPEIISSSPLLGVPSSIQSSSPPLPPRPSAQTPPPPSSSPNRPNSPDAQSHPPPPEVQTPPSSPNLALSSPALMSGRSDDVASPQPGESSSMVDIDPPISSCPRSPLSSPHDEARVPSSPYLDDFLEEESPPLPPLSSPPPLSSLSTVDEQSGISDNDSLTNWGLDLFAFFKLCEISGQMQEQAKISRRCNNYPVFCDGASQDLTTKQKGLLEAFDELFSRNPFSLAVSENLLSGLQKVSNQIQEDPSAQAFLCLQEELVHLKGVIGVPYHRAIYHWHPETPKTSECLLLLCEFGKRALSESHEVFSLPPPSRGSTPPSSPPTASGSIDGRFRRATFAYSLSLPAVIALSNPRQADDRFCLWEQSFRFPFTCIRPFSSRASYSSPLPSSPASRKLFEKLLHHFEHLQSSEHAGAPRLSSNDVRDSFSSLRSFATKLLSGFEAKEWMAEGLSSLSFREQPVSSPLQSVSPNHFLHLVLLVSSSFLGAFDPQQGTLSGLGCDSFFENLWSTITALNVSKETVPRSLRELFGCALQIQTTSDVFAYYHHLLQRCALGCQWLALDIESGDLRTFHFTLQTLSLLLQGCLVELAYML